MIIATLAPMEIGEHIINGDVSSLERKWIKASFIVERLATEEEMFQQLREVGYSIEQYKADCEGNEIYYKVITD